MLMQQVELTDTNGAKMISWIDRDFAQPGRRFDLNLGDGMRSPIMTVTRTWQTVRKSAELQERQTHHRDFGGSIR
jgi:hypothetical protein